jgi:hypothetical protein
VDRHPLDQLVAELERTPGALHVRFAGPGGGGGGRIGSFLEGQLHQAREERRVLALHFEQLACCDSAIGAALMRLVRQAHAVGVGLNVVYSARQRWQALSFAALRRALPSQGDAGTAVHFTET